MNLFEYIKSQLPQMPNIQIMKDLGASDELVEYIRKTPWNTNLNVAGSITNPGGGDAEVWLVGDVGEEVEGSMTFTLSNVDATDHATELYTNGENYNVYLNSTELPYFRRSEGVVVAWSDTNDQTASKMVTVQADGSRVAAFAIYVDASTAPTSVEVSVKAK